MKNSDIIYVILLSFRERYSREDKEAEALLNRVVIPWLVSLLPFNDRPLTCSLPPPLERTSVSFNSNLSVSPQ